MKPLFATLSLVIVVLLIGCDSNPKYSPFRTPAYIDIKIEGRAAPLRISNRAEIRSITRTIDVSFIDDEEFRVKHDGSKNELWIWTDYPYPGGKGGTYPVGFHLQRDGRVCFIASMIRDYEITNQAYIDAVMSIAKKHLTAKGESLDILK